MLVKLLRVSVAALALVAVVGLARAEDEKGEKKEGKNIIELGEGQANFTTILKALKAADLEETLKGKGPYTVFAPDNNAFRRLGNDKVKELLNDKKKLTKILKYHIIEGQKSGPALRKLKGKTIKTLGGDTIKIDVMDGRLTLNGKIQVVQGDVPANNGVVHVINGVLMPPKDKE
jgi:uncharacterized surface protein with fasciclin (FAS1) repeats